METTAIAGRRTASAPRARSGGHPRPPTRLAAGRAGLAIALVLLDACAGGGGEPSPARAVQPLGGATPSFDVFAGQVVSLGRLVHVRVPGATEAELFLRRAGAKRSIRLGVDDGSHPRLAYGPECADPPCTVRDEFSFVLGEALDHVGDGRATLLVVSPIGSGRVVAGREVYWAHDSPAAAIVQPALGTRVPPAGVKVVALTGDSDVIDIRVAATRPFGSCALPEPHVPPFEQHWLGVDLGIGGHASCAPTSIGATLQYLQDNGLADVVPELPDCKLVPDCADPTKLVPSRCLVTTLGEFLDTNVVTPDGPFVGTPTPLLDGMDAYFASRLGLVEGTDYFGNDETWESTSTNVGFPPDRLLLEYLVGGAFTVGGNNRFMSVPADEQFGHFVAVDRVVRNADGTTDLTIMEPHVAPAANLPSCGSYQTYRVAADGTIQYLALPDNVTYPFALAEIVTFRGFDGAPPGCGPLWQLSGKVIKRTRWEGTFTPPAAGPFLLYSETVDRAGHTTRAYQYVIAD